MAQWCRRTHSAALAQSLNGAIRSAASARPPNDANAPAPRRRRDAPPPQVGKRKVQGYLRGYDQFMNLVVEDTIELISLTEKKPIGTVVIRGNSIENFELQEREAVIDRATGATIG